MAEFTLPANSKIGVGDTYKAEPGVKNIKTFLNGGNYEAEDKQAVNS